MLENGSGILAIWHDIEPSGYADFLEWHSREHMPERLAVPGFVRGCRYAVLKGEPAYFNFYETSSPEVLVSEAYLERLNSPSEWTQRVLPFFQNVNRSAGRVLGRVGIGEGGAIATLRMPPAEARLRIERWLLERGLQEIAHRPGVVAAQLWSADQAASQVETEESRSRDHTDVSQWTIAVEANAASHLEAAVAWMLAQPELADRLASESVDVGIYQLQHRLHA